MTMYFKNEYPKFGSKVYSINANVSKDKLLLTWMASILEKTLELTQEGTINVNTSYFFIEICEEIKTKSDKIKDLFN
jgi:hypothetical protein